MTSQLKVYLVEISEHKNWRLEIQTNLVSHGSDILTIWISSWDSCNNRLSLLGRDKSSICRHCLHVLTDQNSCLCFIKKINEIKKETFLSVQFSKKLKSFSKRNGQKLKSEVSTYMLQTALPKTREIWMRLGGRIVQSSSAVSEAVSCVTSTDVEVPKMLEPMATWGCPKTNQAKQGPSDCVLNLTQLHDITSEHWHWWFHM